MNIRKCKQLKDLSLNNNRLVTLTNALGQLQSLNAIHLKGNPKPIGKFLNNMDIRLSYFHPNPIKGMILRHYLQPWDA